jgi:predicted lipid-binding transport protein (Tim44 family)
MAKKDEKSKDKKAKKGKQSAEDGSPAGSGGLSIAAHPRAARRVAQAKGWGGLIGFLLGGYLSLPTNTLAGAGLHALIAGAICYVAVWAGAVFLWRHLVVAELRNRQQEVLQAELERIRTGAHTGAAS